uniref:Putative prenyl transferase n=1 Tax=Penicillium roqueforti TaxID=5082 RepID=A0A1L4BL61_PENRO|nr:putative prenyl transferase [Penicillium roqueforti]
MVGSMENPGSWGLACLLISTSRFNRYMPYYTMMAAMRPLASGKVSTVEALVWMVGQYFLSVKMLDLILDNRSMLPLTASIMLYPYLKRPVFSRVFIYPQYILGLAVAYPSITGWASINGQEQSMSEIFTHCTPICLLIFFWCLYFNTAYSHQDSVDDRKMNINSAYVVAGQRIRLFLAFLGALPLAVIPYVVLKINSPWLWFSWMAVWTVSIVMQIVRFDSKKLESGGRIHWDNFLLGLWTTVACIVEVGLQKVEFWNLI